MTFSHLSKLQEKLYENPEYKVQSITLKALYKKGYITEEELTREHQDLYRRYHDAYINYPISNTLVMQRYYPQSTSTGINYGNCEPTAS